MERKVEITLSYSDSVRDLKRRAFNQLDVAGTQKRNERG